MQRIFMQSKQFKPILPKRVQNCKFGPPKLIAGAIIANPRTAHDYLRSSKSLSRKRQELNEDLCEDRAPFLRHFRYLIKFLGDLCRTPSRIPEKNLWGDGWAGGWPHFAPPQIFRLDSNLRLRLESVRTFLWTIKRLSTQWVKLSCASKALSLCGFYCPNVKA